MTSSCDPDFSAKAVYHLHSCPVRAWLFIHGLLTVDRHNPYIRSGDQRHSRMTLGKRALPLGSFGKVDFSTGHQTELFLHDITRSECIDPAKARQLNYYLHAAHELYGIEAKGIIHMAKNRTHTISYNREHALDDIRQLDGLVNSPIPTISQLPICKGCTNGDWCFS